MFTFHYMDNEMAEEKKEGSSLSLFHTHTNMHRPGSSLSYNPPLAHSGLLRDSESLSVSVDETFINNQHRQKTLI